MVVQESADFADERFDFNREEIRLGGDGGVVFADLGRLLSSMRLTGRASEIQIHSATTYSVHADTIMASFSLVSGRRSKSP